MKRSQLPLCNLRAHKSRTLILLLIVTLEAFCALSGQLLADGFRSSLKLTEARLGADIIVYPSAAKSKIAEAEVLMQGYPVSVSKNRSMLAKLNECENVRQVTYQLYLRDTTGELPRWIICYEPETDFVLSPWTVQGKANSILLGAGIEAEGQTVSLFDAPFSVQDTLLKTDSILDNAVFVPFEELPRLIAAANAAGIETYDSYSSELFSAALIQTTSHEEAEVAANWINVYIRKVKAIRSQDSFQVLAIQMNRQIRMVVGIAVFAWLIFLFAFLLAFSMNVRERLPELRLYHTLGMCGREITQMILLETLYLCILGTAASIPLSLCIKLVLPSGSAVLPFIFRTLILTLLAGILAALASTHHVLREKHALSQQ